MMDEPQDAPGVLLTASHTHLFPGAGLTGSWPGDRSGEVPVLVVFSDAAVAHAVLTPPGGQAGHYRLDVEPYVTAAGTPIGSRGWILELPPGEEAADSRFVVTSRAG